MLILTFIFIQEKHLYMNYNELGETVEAYIDSQSTSLRNKKQDFKATELCESICLRSE